MEATHGPKPTRHLERLTLDNVPLWVRFRRRIEAVSRNRATHMLIDIFDETYTQQFTSGSPVVVAIKRNNYAVKGVLVLTEEKMGLFYVSSETPIAYGSPVLQRAASAAYSRVNGYVWNTPTVYDTLNNIMKFDCHSRPKKFGALPEYVRAKISSEHHTHLRPNEILEAASNTSQMRVYYVRAMVERLRAANVYEEATVSTFLAYVLTADDLFAQFILDSCTLWSGVNGVEELNKRLKLVSGQIKSINTSTYEPLTQMFELTVLVNRGVGSVDWAAERDHRVNPNTANVKPGDVYVSARKIFERASKDYNYPTMQIDEYLDRRWEWVPGGSVHSQYEEDNAYIIPGMYTRNKFVTVNLMPKHALRRFLGSKPQIRAWPSTKYEWGKQRAIYGTDLRSTIITNFAMFRCEDVLSTLFPVGSEAEASKVHKRISMMLDHSGSFCFDYDDFNSQHSIPTMHAVLLAFRDTFKHAMSRDQQIAMDWVCNSVRDMAVLDRTTDKWYQLNGTLLSGWRLTTFINTVLNWVYMDIAGVFKLDDVSDSVHNGDDVMIAITRPKTAIQIMERMGRINARAQVTKCNLFTVAEFLRVEHGAIGVDGLGAQYLTRSCATLVHSRIESREPVMLTRLLEADQDRLRDLASRTNNKEAVRALERQLEKRCCKVFGASLSSVRHIKRLHRVCGGINNERWAPIDSVVIRQPEQTNVPVEVDDPSSWPGVFDYASKIDKLFGDNIPFRSILGAIVQGSRLTLAIAKKEKIQVRENEDTSASEWERAMYGTYKGVTTTYYAAMSKFVGIPPLANVEKGAASYYISAVKASSNKMRAMQILA